MRAFIVRLFSQRLMSLARVLKQRLTEEILEAGKCSAHRRAHSSETPNFLAMLKQSAFDFDLFAVSDERIAEGISYR